VPKRILKISPQVASYTLVMQSFKTYLPSSEDELERNLDLVIPSMFYEDLESIDWTKSVSEECDGGWMYKNNLETVSGSCDDDGNINQNDDA